MKNPLLTIVIPTYNRNAKLLVLLETLRLELHDLANSVDVLVSDNASTDGTDATIARMSEQWPNFRTQRHQTNIGAEKNFLSCICNTKSRYIWVIGDDDCPRPGLIKQIVSLLLTEEPALISMGNEGLTDENPNKIVEQLSFECLTSLEFSKKVNIWTTFISGIIFDKHRLDQELGDEKLDRFCGTSLVQLGWVLPLLRTDSRFLYIGQKVILASENTNWGYDIKKVFCLNYPVIVNEVFGTRSRLARTLISEPIKYYLPGLIWASRSGTQMSANENNRLWQAIINVLGGYPYFWILILPIGRGPKLLARSMFALWLFLKRFRRLLHN